MTRMSDVEWGEYRAVLLSQVRNGVPELPRLTQAGMRDEFDSFLEEGGLRLSGSGEGDVKVLVRWLRGMLGEVMGGLDIGSYRKCVNEFVRGVMDREVGVGDFTLSGEVMLGDIQGLLMKLYCVVQTEQESREVLSGWVSYLKGLLDWLGVLKRSVDTFVSDPYSSPISFVGVTDRKRVCENLLADVYFVEGELQGMVSRLVSVLDNVVGARISLLLKAESSLRLLVRFQSDDIGINRLGSRPMSGDGLELREAV